MATETKGKFVFPTIFGIDQEIKKNPNYRPQFWNQNFPHLSSSIPNHNDNLIKIEKSTPSLSFSDLTLDSGPIVMDDEPMRVARSVAAGCLLSIYSKTEPVFIPVVSEIMVGHLIRCHLITPSEKEALLKAAAGDNSDEKKMTYAMPEEDSEDTKEKMISAIGKALLSMEKDTGAVTCFFVPLLDGKGKDRVYAMSIQPEKLVKELLPVSLRFRDLTISPTDITDAEEYQRQKRERIKQLTSKEKWVWLECPDKYITKPETTPTITPAITPTPRHTRARRRFRYRALNRPSV